MTDLHSLLLFFFFKQKTAYEIRISDWSSDVCSSDLARPRITVSSSSVLNTRRAPKAFCRPLVTVYTPPFCATSSPNSSVSGYLANRSCSALLIWIAMCRGACFSGSLSLPPKTSSRRSPKSTRAASFATASGEYGASRSAEHTSELQSLMRNAYAVFCLKNKRHQNQDTERQT